MSEENNIINPSETSENIETSEAKVLEVDQPESVVDTSGAEQIIQSTIFSGVLGFVNFDGGVTDNTTTGALVSEERRRLFKRDVYVGIKDSEQNIEFLGRIVQGPFHTPHEIGADSAITRTTVLHPERTKFRPSYYVSGNIELLGQLLNGERVVPTPTRPRPYCEIYIFPPDRLRKLLEIEGNILIGQLMGYEAERIEVKADSDNKNFLPRNVGIFGTIGSGKSNTVQVLVEEAISTGWAAVIIDVEGEYVKMNEATERQDMLALLAENYGLSGAGIPDFNVYVPSSGDSDATNPILFKVPIAQLDSNVVFDIQEFSEPQQRMFERVVSFTIRINQQARTSRLGNLGSAAQIVQPFIGELNTIKNRYPRYNRKLWMDG